MRVGILGAGSMGGKLGTLFARAGHHVTFSYARGESKLKRLAREAGENARAGTPSEAARDADALLLAVHWSRVDDVLKQAGDLSGKVVVSCSLPMNADDTRLAVGHTSSGAEVLARKIRRAKIVSAFGTVPSEVLFGVFDARRKSNDRACPIAATTPARRTSRRRSSAMTSSSRSTRAPCRTARYLQPFALLMGQLAYEGDGRPEIAYRIERFGK